MNTENIENDDGEKKTDDSIKITIDKDVEKLVAETVNKINDGYEGGKVSRQIVASWLLDKACKEISDSDVKAIRTDNFNAVNALSAVLRKAQETGVVPLELRQILFAQVGLDTPTKKNVKSKLTKTSTNGGVDIEGEAEHAV